MRGHAVPVLLAVVAGSALWQAPQALVDTLRDISADAGRSRSERALAPVIANDLPAEVFLGAERLIPEDATYAVVVGENLPLRGNQPEAITPLLRYWLLPRRWTGNVSAAGWVIAVGASTETLGVPLGEQTEVSPAVVVAEVAR